MSPERKTSFVKVGSVVSLISAIAYGFFASPLPEAMARRMAGPDVETLTAIVTSNAVATAVAIADEHIAERIEPIESRLEDQTKEMRRMADKQALMSERMGEMVGELKRIK